MRRPKRTRAASVRDARRARRARDGDAALVSRLRDVRHRVACAARRPGRPQARPPPRAVRDVRRRLPPREGLLQVRPRRRRRHGHVPPARRLLDLRRAGPPRAAVVDADAAGGLQRQLRLPGQRPGRGHAVHRVQDGAAVHGDGPGHRRGDRRLPGQLRRPQPGADGPAGRASRTCWSTARPASRSAWRPTSRRTTCARSPPAPSGTWSNPEASHEELLDALIERIKGPDFPTGALVVGRKGIEEAYRTGPWLDHDARGRRGRGDPEPPVPGRHRAAVPGQPRQPRAEDRRPGEGRQGRRHRGRPRRDLVAYRPAARDRAEAGRGRQGRAEQPLQAHRSADELRREHAGAGRRGAAHAVAGRVHPALGDAPDRGHRPRAPASGCARPRSGRTSCAVCSRRWTRSTRSSR